MKKVLFLTHENFGKTAVAKAMFLDVITKISHLYSCSIVSANHYKGNQRDGKIDYHYFKRKNQGKISLFDLFNLMMSFFYISKLIYRHDVLYIRSYPMTIMFFLVSKVFNKKLIFDTRGLFFEELFDSGKFNSHRLRKLLGYMEKLLLKYSDRVVCVSSAQKEYYQKIVPSEEKYIVIFNGAVECSAVRDVSNHDGYIVGYVGSLISWHCPELMYEVLLELEKISKISFHCVTRDVDKAKIYFSKLSNVKVYSHNYRESPIHFDLGLCFISRSISKEVCFPVKFSEYLVARTPIAFSDNVSVCNDIHNDYNVGIPININEDPKYIACMINKYLSSNEWNNVKLPGELSFSQMVNKVSLLIDDI